MTFSALRPARAGTEEAGEPDLVMACAGDIPTLETLAAMNLLREAFHDLKIRVVNVVDIMALRPREQHTHGLSDKDFDRFFHTPRVSHQCVILHASHIRIIPTADAITQCNAASGPKC